MKTMLLSLLAFLSLSFETQAAANNLHQIDSDKNGFAIFRTSQPNRADMRKFCELGIQEMMVLSGTAESHEFKYQDECPTLKVVYNTKQNSRVPLDKAFLDSFDEWVKEAKATGKKIAFRCSCGCHRTGRLAAYYQMKYQKISTEDAKSIMTARGKWMLFMPHLYPMVEALNDYIYERPCSTAQKYCVTP